jgi:ABC-type multidrug transport system fused ATPase/permease subunit
MACSQALLMISEYWLRFWAGGSFWPQTDVRHVVVLACLTVGCIVIGFFRATCWFQFTVHAASDLHEKALWHVMHSPMAFFISNPTGRILNRFAKDQSLADEFLPVTLFDALQGGLFCLASLILICIAEPWLVILMPFLLASFLYFRRKYMKSSMEIKRIEAVTRSPIYADFSAVLEGLQTLRAYDLEHAATVSFEQQLDTNIRAWFSFLYVSRWLGFRLDSTCAVLMIVVSLVSVALRDVMDVGLLSFAIVYTLSLSGLLQWTVRQSAEVETQMTSVERIASYVDLPPEPGYVSTLANYRAVMDDQTGRHRGAGGGAGGGKGEGGGLGRPAVRGGAVNVRNLRVQYRAETEAEGDTPAPAPVINDLSLDIPAGLKLSVVGRTGCGKSTFLQALLRLNVITRGDILIDGESLLKMDLERARSVVSVIPQDPHLFSGSVRYNLDPFSLYSDAEVWSALEDAHIKEFIASDPLGLGKGVEEGGKNFSVGQRQLLSLARAILRRCPIVLMDEVTASVDYATDRLIQTTIRTTDALKHATIITVAHRLLTVADSDMVVVLEAGGSIGEMGRPKDLLARSDSLFAGFARQSNELEEITRIANDAQ